MKLHCQSHHLETVSREKGQLFLSLLAQSSDQSCFSDPGNTCGQELVAWHVLAEGEAEMHPVRYFLRDFDIVSHSEKLR